MKITKGSLKVIFVSKAALIENRQRAMTRGAKLVPAWVVFVYQPPTDEQPGSYTSFAAHSFEATRVVPRTNFRDDRPYSWIPSNRPGYPGESLLGTSAWIETEGELTIDIEDKFNV